ncbi:TPA: restriction endonuclease subunit S [Legionella pneumophila]|nr:restriction endonuclease subunit S [Legionella pneumophila]
MAADNNLSELEFMQARIKNVPNGWGFSTVGKTFSIKNNLRKPINENDRNKNIGQYPYYGPTKIQGYIDTYEQDGSYVLIGEDGDHFLKFERQSMTQLVDGKCTVNNHAHIIEGTHKATREWFYYYFMHRDIFSFLSRQGAGRYKLNKASLEKIPILVPPVSEQKKIAQILSTWDKAITTTEKLLANSEQQKKALMQQLLTGKKRFSEFQEAWRVKTVSDFGHVVTGNTPSKTIKKNYGDSICWATAEDFKSKYINDTRIKLSQEGALRARVLPAGSVLITCIASIGKNAIASTTLATNQQINAVIINTENSNEYFYYLMEFHKKELIALAGTTAVPILNKASFQKIKVSVPSFEEQRKIASLLSTVDIQRENLKMQLEKLCNEKKALMQQLLTGKKRVKIQEEGNGSKRTN